MVASYHLKLGKAVRDIPLDNLSYSLRLELDTGSSGSGFVVNSATKSFLVTAKHVLFAPVSGQLLGQRLKVIGYSSNLEDGDVIEYSISISAINARNQIFCNGNEDIALIELGDLAQTRALTLKPDIQIVRMPMGRVIGVGLSNMKRINDVLIANTVFVQGYPSSVGLQNIPQLDYEKPLIRRGIVAGKNLTLNTIVLDCEVHPGNSGGPVVEAEKHSGGIFFKVIGLVSQYVPFILPVNAGNSATPPGYVVNNSGYSIVVPCDSIIDLINAHP